MAISSLSAAKTLCELRGWTISNLELQKILYLAHMFHMGAHNGAPLIEESFEAWDYGPVVPEVYKRARTFGSGPVQNVFHWINGAPNLSAEYRSLYDASEGTKSFSAGQLVANTHWDDGAWALYYKPNVKGIKIPNAAILNEYRKRSALHNPGK